ncbi:Uncharacterised protein [Vibrio cholerae]|uniref:Uncharacterized protein n=1 Tax=Vibrio cholerae TaxID=666 RepID=A0A655PUP8_VIBCL|nr:Uncharacterised protein [Vibrio cholerae]CSA25688.1 Uncharacterised protein [Vibrio cholerae]CSB74609.1 Uncharacterised protein [Vibrio cholerae]
MGWNRVFITKNIFNRSRECVVAAAAAVGFITTEHGGLHLLRDSASAAVGEQVNKYIFTIEQKGVHSGI